MYVNRPFYLESKLSGHRFVGLMNNNLVIQSQTGEAHQQFKFDDASMTIKSVAQPNKSINIASNGGSTNLDVSPTNDKWW